MYILDNILKKFLFIYIENIKINERKDDFNELFENVKYKRIEIFKYIISKGYF